MLGNHGGDSTAVVVNGFLATEYGIKGLAFGIGCNFRSDLHGILRFRINAHSLMGSNGQRFAQNWIAVCATHGSDNDFTSLGFHDFEGPDQCVPFVIRVDDELNPFFIEAGVPVGKRDARRGIWGFADAD